jgi:hypothetical protein
MTKQCHQEDWNEIYTGEEFSIEDGYSSMHTVTWVALTFSSAMPLLYAVGAVYYIGLYWIDKYLMFNFYRKS